MAKIQVRRDTATAWRTANPILSSGEIGVTTDSRIMKMGDGVTAWNALLGTWIGGAWPGWSDNFNRTNGDPGTNWVRFANYNTSVYPVINTNRIVGATSGTDPADMTDGLVVAPALAPPSPTYFVEASIGALTKEAGLILGATETTSHAQTANAGPLALFLRVRPAGWVVLLARTASAAYTVVDSGAAAQTAGGTIRVEHAGNTVTFKYKGATLWSGTMPGAVTGRQPGISVVQSTDAVDDFTIGTL